MVRSHTTTNYRPHFPLVRLYDGLTFIALIEIRTTLLVHGHGSNSSHRKRLAGRTSRTCRLQDLRGATSTRTWPRELQAILRADPVDDIAKRTARRRWGITDDHLHIHMDPVVGLPTRHFIAQRKCSWFVIFLNAVYMDADVTTFMCSPKLLVNHVCLGTEW